MVNDQMSLSDGGRPRGFRVRLSLNVLWHFRRPCSVPSVVELWLREQNNSQNKETTMRKKLTFSLIGLAVFGLLFCCREEKAIDAVRQYSNRKVLKIYEEYRQLN
jgi:hypothetical protein